MSGRYHLLDLSDELLYGILYSGYLGFDWNSLKNVVLSCPRLAQIGYERCQYVKLSKYAMGCTSYIPGLSSTLKRVQYLDMGLVSSSITLTACACEAITKWSNTMRALDLRYVQITDDQLKMICKEMSKLQYLNLARSQRSSVLITDESGKFIRYLTNLQYLNLSNTGITDVTIASLVDDQSQSVSRPLNLQYLLLDGCNALTDSALQSISTITTLTHLDISSNNNFTAHGFLLAFNHNA